MIKGYSPASVFAVVGTRKLWDEWYEEGNLVENLNDTSSLTYMCMKGIVGSRCVASFPPSSPAARLPGKKGSRSN